MASYNRIIMMGNLTRDPEHKQLSSGQAVCRLGLASNRQFKNKQTGTMVQEVCFVDVDVWGPQAESCRQYLSKGRSVLVEGRLKLDSWQEADGTKRSKHSIVADRVTFLAAGAQGQAEDGEGLSDESEFVPATTKSAMPVSEAPSVAKPKRASAPKASTMTENLGITAPSGEVTFKDEAPFEDDLPF